ncbi:MAG: C45 family peptidase [Burkholderiaceae bacterium]
MTSLTPSGQTVQSNQGHKTKAAKAPPLHIIVRGDAATRGRQYGQQTVDRIHRSLRAYRTMFETCDISWTEAQQRALLCIPLIEQTFPDLLEELQGIAEGSKVDFSSLMALNCRSEILPPDYLVRATKLAADQLPDAGHISECTSFAFARDGQPVWLAQNWDWVGSQREALVTLEAHPEDGPAYFTVTEAGMLAKIGFNEHGLGVTLNILRSANDGEQAGIPVHVLLRGLLDCEDVSEATDLARGLQYAGSSNVMVADPSGAIASIELAPNGARVLPSEGGQLCHTNHFLHPELAGGDSGLTGNLSTEARLKTARENISTINDFDGIKDLLSHTGDGPESVCRFPDTSLPSDAQVETVVGVAMDLSNKVLQISAAQPSVTAFTAYTLVSQSMPASAQ